MPKEIPKIGATACKVQTTPPTIDTRRETTDILNKILPPKQWEEDGQIWTQQVRFLCKHNYNCNNKKTILINLCIG